MTNLLTRVISGKRRNSNTNRKEKDESEESAVD